MTICQNRHLTFRGNAGAGRHGWLRLTPAYSYRMAEDALADAIPGEVALDPFAGTGTTGLAAAQDERRSARRQPVSGVAGVRQAPKLLRIRNSRRSGTVGRGNRRRRHEGLADGRGRLTFAIIAPACRSSVRAQRAGVQ